MELFELLFLGMVIGQVRDQKEQKKRYHTQDIEIKQRAETLFWNIITKSYEEKYEIVDFGRTSAFNAGLMKFKSQWGTQVMDFQHFFYPALYCGTDESQQEESISKRALSFISKHSNSFLLEQLGNFCYRHLG